MGSNVPNQTFGPGSGPLPALSLLDGQSVALSLIDGHPGPAWILDGADDVVAVNTPASTLRIQQALAAIAAAARLNGHGRHHRLVVDAKGIDAATYDVTAVPLGAGAVAILGRDVSLDRDLTNALVASRERYRDLAQCAGGFAFETDTEGHFTYVALSDNFGLSSEDLIGVAVAGSDTKPRALDPTSPFVTREAVDEVEVRLIAPDGAPRILAVSARAVCDDQGAWLGARGIGRDITRERTLCADAALRVERDRMVNHVIASMRRAPDPLAMLVTAVEQTAAVVDLPVWLLRRDEDGTWRLAVASGEDPAESVVDALGARIDDSDDTDRALIWAFEDQIFHVRPLRVGDHVRGGLVIARADHAAAWPETAEGVMEALVAPISIAMTQVDQIERLRMLSTIDPLTGLLNRRALGDALEGRLAMGRRQARAAVFAFIDIDYFKQVNDTLGHARGDRLLADFGTLLRKLTRANDVVGRLGGDEFGMWLDATDIAGAVAKIKALRYAFAKIAPPRDQTLVPVGLSVGLSEVQAGETLEDLIARADRALYQAKRSGRGQSFVDAPSQHEMPA